MYFLVAQFKEDFKIDFCEAWRCQPGSDMKLIMFVDNGNRLEIPISSAMDDQALMKHMHCFYDLIRSEGGIFEFFGAKSSQRIDVVKVRHSNF